METPTHQRKSVVQLSYVIIMIYESVKAIWKIMTQTNWSLFQELVVFLRKDFRTFIEEIQMLHDVARNSALP